MDYIEYSTERSMDYIRIQYGLYYGLCILEYTVRRETLAVENFGEFGE